MEKSVKKAIEEYQCSGCVSGHDISCFTKDPNTQSCGKHVAGTRILGLSKILLGLPKGFNRLGEFGDMRPEIYTNIEEYGGYDKWNVPTWKYKNKAGHTLVRGLSPRVNKPFIHIFLEDCLDKVDCYEVTEEDINFMD